MDMIIPTLVDPTMAPPGKHVISCFVQYAPYRLGPSLGTWDDNREAFGDAVIDRIAEFAPNIRDIIVGRQVLTPLDIERMTGLTEGNIFQGELSLEQLFFNRPVPGYARFRTPDPRSLAVRLARPIRAAGSWAPTAGWRPWRCSAPRGGRRPEMTTTATRYDTIVVGGGHNGLVAAAYLAKARPAGARAGAARARRRQCHDRASWRPASACRRSPTPSGGSARRRARPRAAARHGLALVAPDVRVFAPSPDGRAVVLRTDPTGRQRACATVR